MTPSTVSRPGGRSRRAPLAMFLTAAVLGAPLAPAAASTDRSDPDPAGTAPSAALLGADPTPVSGPRLNTDVLADTVADPVSNCGVTERVSVASDGTQQEGSGFGANSAPSISADGRVVTFDSDASNLVPDNTNGEFDVFAHDRATGSTKQISVASDGTGGDNLALNAGPGAVSADGRFVGFASSASNLVPGDTNGSSDVFVHDRETGITERVSVASDGGEANFTSADAALSADGRLVAFVSNATNLVDGVRGWQIWIHDRQTGVTELVSRASDGTPGAGGTPFAVTRVESISAGGRYVAFQSDHTNLVPDDTNGDLSPFDGIDVFVHDRQTGITERVSVASDGTQANDSSGYSATISDDGRFVAFRSEASNLVADDTNRSIDIFVHDRKTGVTERVSVSSDGTEGSLPNPRHVAGGNLGISADGRFVRFITNASNLVPGDTTASYDTFVHDRETDLTMRVSVAPDCTAGNASPILTDASAGPTNVRADGHVVAFRSAFYSNLVPGDTNGVADVFVHTLPTLHVTPITPDFGPVETGGTRSMIVTLTNISQAEVTVGDVTEPAAPFGVGGTCGAAPFTLAPAGSCDLEVTFSPSAAGTFTDDLVLSGDALDGPYTVSLTGVGSSQPVHLAPDTVDLGGVIPGETSKPEGVTVTNASAASVEVSAVSGPAAPFTTAGGTCGEPPFSLKPYATCSLDYTFAPTEAGDFTDGVELSSDASGSPHGFALRGRGLVQELTVAPGEMEFGEVPVGESSDPQAVTLTNTGEVDLRLSDVSVSDAQFRLEDFSCQTVLPVGASCTLDYEFSPAVPGEVSAEVTIAHNAPSSPDTVTLRGSGTTVGGGVLEFDPQGLQFGEVEPGSTTPPQTATLHNTGRVALTGLTFTEPGGGFEADTSACGNKLRPDASCEVRVTFRADQSGPTVAILGVTSNQDASVALALYGQGAGGRTWAETGKLTASDGAGSDGLGWTVAVDGDTAIVGAPFVDVSGSDNQGAAYVFRRTDGAWTEQAKLVASDGAEGDTFGDSVAIHGDTVLVGARRATVDGNSFQGAAYVFTRSNGVWTEQAKLTASNDRSTNGFGFAVAVSGDTALISSPWGIVGQAEPGAAWVFTRDGDVWTEQAKLAASDGATGVQFGCSVALEGDTALIGAPKACLSVREYSSGAAYVFTRSNGVWTEDAKLTASDATGAWDGDMFGYSVALSDDTAVVGAPGQHTESHLGAAYVFTHSNGAWVEQTKLSASDETPRNNFGKSVALEGDTILVGARFARADGSRPGAAYVFTRYGGPWNERAKLVPSEAEMNATFGRSVDLSGGTALVGARRAHGDCGAAYLFAPGTAAGDVPDGITLTASGRTDRGERSVIVSWQGASSDEVDVFRDGELIATVANPGFYSDPVGGHGRARYVYQVCEAGTEACSNEAVVTFGGPAKTGGGDGGSR